MLRVCNLSRELRDSERVLIPVESTIRTRKDVSLERNSGSARNGLEAMLSSSRLTQAARAGGSARRKFADMSSARSVLVMCGRVLVRNEGTALGVLDDPISK